MIGNFLSKLFGSSEPYSYRIHEGIDSKGRPVFVAQIFIPGPIGWVYLRQGSYITQYRDHAEIFQNKEDAEIVAKASARLHQEMDEQKRITWK